MSPYRLKNALLSPWRVLRAKIDPVGYARSMGVRMLARLTVNSKQAEYKRIFIVDQIR